MRNGFLDQFCQRVVCITLIKEQSKIREDYRRGRPQVARERVVNQSVLTNCFNITQVHRTSNEGLVIPNSSLPFVITWNKVVIGVGLCSYLEMIDEKGGAR